MAGKKFAAPAQVYVVLGAAMYGMQLTLQGVYVSHDAALEAASGDPTLVTSVALNYSDAYVSQPQSQLARELTYCQ